MWISIWKCLMTRMVSESLQALVQVTHSHCSMTTVKCLPWQSGYHRNTTFRLPQTLNNVFWSALVLSWQRQKSQQTTCSSEASAIKSSIWLKYELTELRTQYFYMQEKCLKSCISYYMYYYYRFRIWFYIIFDTKYKVEIKIATQILH